MSWSDLILYPLVYYLGGLHHGFLGWLTVEKNLFSGFFLLKMEAVQASQAAEKERRAAKEKEEWEKITKEFFLSRTLTNFCASIGVAPKIKT